MDKPKASGTGEAPSARHSVTDKANGSKNHNPNTGKQHTYAVPGCALTKIEIKCSHVKEEKPAAKPPPGGHPASGPPAKGKEEGSRVITLPEENAAKKPESAHAAPVHPAPAHKVVGGEVPSGHNIAEPALLKGEVSVNKAFMGVVPSGRKTTEKASYSFLKGVVKIEAEHSYGANTVGDKVKCAATIKGKCSKHPLWTITDGGKQVAAINKDIVDYEFLPPAPDKNQLESVFHAWWLKGVKPRVYEVTCKTCKGAEEIGPVTIDVYPNMESKVSVDFGDAEKEEKEPASKAHTLAQVVEEFVKSLHVLEEEFGLNPAKYVEWPRGKIALSNKWEEDEKSPQAYWGGALEIGLDPLIGMKTPRISIPVLKALKFVPKFIRKYVDMDVYAQATGDLKLTTALEWSLKSDHDMQIKGDVKDTLGGEIKLEVGAEGKVRIKDENVVSAFIKGKTTVGADGSLKFTQEGEVELEGKLFWKGLSVAGEILFLNGRYERDVEAEVIKGSESRPMTMLLVKKDEAETR